MEGDGKKEDNTAVEPQAVVPHLLPHFTRSSRWSICVDFEQIFLKTHNLITLARQISQTEVPSLIRPVSKSWCVMCGIKDRYTDSEAHHCSHFWCTALSLDFFLRQKVKPKLWSICNSFSVLFTVILIFLNVRQKSCSNFINNEICSSWNLLSQSSKVNLKWTTKHSAVQTSPGQFTAQSR